MNKNILITMICFFLMSSCSQIKKNKIKDETLPTNSATRLVNERKSYTDINEPNVKNIDIINGFRELKLNTGYIGSNCASDIGLLVPVISV